MIGRCRFVSRIPVSVIDTLESRTLFSAFTPAQVAHAYGFDQIAFINSSGQSVKGDGSGQTIAIVDAYDDPNVATDLAIFDNAYGLSNNDAAGAFVLTKATPQGTPAVDGGWSQEISLDVQWAHAIAPKAHILLVEALNSSLNNLLSAVDYARKQAGVVAVSMSWGAGEFSSESTYDSHFTTPSKHPGVTFIASSGDTGAQTIWPAVSPNVVGVGGTSLYLNTDGSYGSESAWSGSGGGISAYESKPAYQSSVTQSSTKRTSPDISYDADPYTGFPVYDSVNNYGWMQFGGTSAGAPQWAALVAIADQGRALAGKTSLDGASQALPAIYAMNTANFHDITTGTTGFAATAGYDLATGRGTPLANIVVKDLVAAGSSSTSTGGNGGKRGGPAASPADALIDDSAALPDSGLLANSLIARAPFSIAVRGISSGALNESGSNETEWTWDSSSPEGKRKNRRQAGKARVVVGLGNAAARFAIAAAKPA